MKYAELAKKDGMTFGLGMGGSTNTDATDTHGALFHAYGAKLIDAKGNVTARLRRRCTQCLEFIQKLVKFYPDDAVSYDDASNNRALISGKSALIFNPPSAWAVAKRDAPRGGGGLLDLLGADGSQGPLSCRRATFFWGVWQFSQNQTAGKELITYLMEREQVEERDNGVAGYDLPPYRGHARLQDLGRLSSRRRARSTIIRSARGTTRSPA